MGCVVTVIILQPSYYVALRASFSITEYKIRVFLTVCLRGLLQCVNLFSGDQKGQTYSTDSCTIMFNIHVLRRWSAYVVPMVGTAGIHGHVVGLWKVPSHCVRIS